MVKTNIGKAVNPHRMTDVEYIQYLEETITIMHSRIDTFIHALDKQMFAKTMNPADFMEVYANNVYLLKLPKE